MAAEGQWPGWHHDERTIEYWTEQLRKDLEKVLTPSRAERLARDYAATDPKRDGKSDEELAALAAAWLARRGPDLAPVIAGTLTRVHADGAAIGAASASALLAGGTSAALGTWQPGRTSAALGQLRAHDPGYDPATLAALDTDKAVQDIAATRRSHIARALALGTAAGLATHAIGTKMRDALTMGLAAVAAYELIGAVSRAAMALFGRRGVELGRWLIDPRSKVCPICIANAEAGPRPLGQSYPSGEAYSPAHPHCACAVVPA